MTKATSAAQVLRKIACPHLSLYRGQGYWYFVYDDLEKNGTFETQSVHVMYMKDASLKWWVAEGEAFVETILKSKR